MTETPIHDLRQLLLVGNSRSYTDYVASIARKRPELVPQLWDVYLSVEEPVSRRAAWILDTLSLDDPQAAEPYLQRLVACLNTFNHDGLKRHAVHMLSRMPFPEGAADVLIDTCFRWLLSGTESVAVKMYCMLILYRISASEPDILPELYDTIEFQLDEVTPGFRNIGVKMMNRIDRDIINRKTQKKESREGTP